MKSDSWLLFGPKIWLLKRTNLSCCIWLWTPWGGSLRYLACLFSWRNHSCLDMLNEWVYFIVCRLFGLHGFGPFEAFETVAIILREFLLRVIILHHTFASFDFRFGESAHELLAHRCLHLIYCTILPFFALRSQQWFLDRLLGWLYLHLVADFFRWLLGVVDEGGILLWWGSLCIFCFLNSLQIVTVLEYKLLFTFCHYLPVGV